MARRHNREINVFSVSAIDLFACGMGVFIILYMILIPLLTKAPKPGDQVQKAAATMAEVEAKNRNLEAELLRVSTQLANLSHGGVVVERMNREVQELRAELAAKEAEAEKSAEEIKALKVQLESTKKALEVEISRQGNDQGSPSDEAIKNLFIQVKLKWFNEATDVDLIVVDSRGNEFTPEKPAAKGAPGRHMGDSRGGPGLELWQCFQGYPGVYRVFAMVKPGGHSAAEVGGQVELNRGMINIPRVSVAPGQRVEVLKFEVNKTGEYRSL